MNINSVRSISDEQLLRDVEMAAAHERKSTAQLIALLAEMDTRRLYLQLGYASLFVYCTRCLHFSEHAAYGRIEAARAARKFPLVLERLADGSITLTAICLLSNYLTADNHPQVLSAATHKSRRDVEEQVAALRPMNAVPSAVRKLPQAKSLTTSLVSELIVEPVSTQIATSSTPITTKAEPSIERPLSPPVARPLAPDRYKVQFTISPDTHRK